MSGDTRGIGSGIGGASQQQLWGTSAAGETAPAQGSDILQQAVGVEIDNTVGSSGAEQDVQVVEGPTSEAEKILAVTGHFAMGPASFALHVGALVVLLHALDPLVCWVCREMG